MELTSKQRAQLRGLASVSDTIVQIGKDGVTDAVIQSVKDALKARELIKCKVLENSMLTPREACAALCEACKAEPVQVIGTKFVLYRPSHKKDKKDKIVLPKAVKKPV